MSWLSRFFDKDPRAAADRDELHPDRSFAPPLAEPPLFPTALGHPHFDADGQRLIQLPPERQETLIQVGQRVRDGSVGLPGLSSTSLQAVDLVQSDQVDLGEIVELVEQDPVLSGEVLRSANSALLGAHGEVDQVQAAAVRLGIRRLNDIILGVALRSSLFRDREVQSHAQEVWRQAVSVAAIARAVAPGVGIDPASAHSLGLLADIGRIPLLAHAAKYLVGDPDEDHAFLSKLFFLYHERIGAAIGRAWHLPPELVAVASCHHRFASNQEAPREAALIGMAHLADACLASGDRSRFVALVQCEELQFLEDDPDDRRQHLNRALLAYVEVHPETLPEPEEGTEPEVEVA